MENSFRVPAPRVVITLASLIVVAMLPTGARAQVSGSWLLDANGNWSLGSNWSGGGFPTAGGTATLGTPTTLSAFRTVTLDTN
ncbi:MAG: hypothetical protein ACREJC_18500, partial [Tepidisphaeraceae bacterium]